VLLYVLFYLGFSSQASGILPYIAPPSRLVQVGLMFGTFLFAAACFLGSLLAETARARGWTSGEALRPVARAWLWVCGLSFGPYLLVIAIALAVLSSGLLKLHAETNGQLQSWLGGLPAGAAFWRILWLRISSPWTFLAFSLPIAAGLAAILNGARAPQRAEHPRPGPAAAVIQPAAVFAALLMVVGLALALLVEFFYLRDSFGLRMNTVFKFYFQAWVLLGVASAFGAWWTWQHARPWLRGLLAGGLGLLTAAGLLYSGMGIAARVHNFTLPPNLDATTTLAGLYPEHWGASPDDWAASDWLNRHVSGAPTILEAPYGGSYNLRGRISAFTGLPTLQGWFGHEYQWRGSGAAYSARSADVRAIFTGADEAQTLALLQRWNVRFVIIGKIERDYIVEQCTEQCDPDAALVKFGKLLLPVFSQGGTIVYRVPEYN
jgi:uncharacterized membrane protein